MPKIWFITGSSRGFGRGFVEAALSRGDKVAATARNTDSLADLVAAHGDQILPLPLDVTDKAAVTAVVQQAHERFGRLDVVVNNAGFGLYRTSKAAVEGLSDSLAQEVAGFGIKVTVVEPAPFATEFATSSIWSEPVAAYDGVRDAVNGTFATLPSPSPDHVGAALLKIVDADKPPLRVFFGTLAHQVVPQIYTERLKTWEDWAQLSAQAETSRA